MKIFKKLFFHPYFFARLQLEAREFFKAYITVSVCLQVWSVLMQAVCRTITTSMLGASS